MKKLNLRLYFIEGLTQSFYPAMNVAVIKTHRSLDDRFDDLGIP